MNYVISFIKTLRKNGYSSFTALLEAFKANFTDLLKMMRIKSFLEILLQIRRKMFLFILKKIEILLDNTKIHK